MVSFISRQLILVFLCPAVGYEQGGYGRRRYDADDIYGDAGGEGQEEGMVPLGKEPQLWEFARDVVTSLVSDLAVVRVRTRNTPPWLFFIFLSPQRCRPCSESENKEHRRGYFLFFCHRATADLAVVRVRTRNIAAASFVSCHHTLLQSFGQRSNFQTSQVTLKGVRWRRLPCCEERNSSGRLLLGYISRQRSFKNCAQNAEGHHPPCSVQMVEICQFVKFVRGKMAEDDFLKAERRNLRERNKCCMHSISTRV